MDIKEYIDNSDVVTLSEFSKMGNDAIKFDFLTQGEEADRTPLTNEIYHEIFPWFDDEIDAGDTLNTYRIAIKKFYGKYFWQLEEDVQTEIVKIISDANQKYLGDNNLLLSFDDVRPDGREVVNISNNYTLGNFGILPTKGGMNPKRAQVPFDDFFDLFLVQISDFYDDNLDEETELGKAISENSEYFNQFSDIDDFLRKNFLQDFITIDEDGQRFAVELSVCDDFASYVNNVVSIISSRGERMYRALTKSNELVEYENNKNNHIIDTEELTKHVSQQEAFIRENYDELDDTTISKFAKLGVYDDYLDEKNNLWTAVKKKETEISEDYNDKTNKLDSQYNNDIETESNNRIYKKFGWTKWWYWIVLYLVLSLVKSLYSSHLKNLAFEAAAGMDRVNNFYQFSNFIFFLFWIALIAKIIYNIVFWKREGEFYAKKGQREENLESNYKKDQDILRTNYNEKINDLQNFYEKELHEIEMNNAAVKNLIEFLPSKFRNDDGAYNVYQLLVNRRVTNLSEAYSLIEDQEHRQRILNEEQERTRALRESEARKAAAIEESARMQAMAAQAAEESARRQAEQAERQAWAAEDMARENERHNREIEDRLKGR